MQGVIQTKKNTFIFRDDISDDFPIWAWDIYDPEDRTKTHKWDVLPRNGIVHLFDLSNPPATVGFIPLLQF